MLGNRLNALMLFNPDFVIVSS